MATRNTCSTRFLPTVPCLAFLSPGASAVEIIVDPNGGGDYTSLPPAVRDAQYGDTIIVMPGVYTAGFIVRAKSLTVRSAAPDDPGIVASTVLDSAPIELYNAPDFGIHGFTMRNSAVSDGGALFVVESRLHLSRCVLENNFAPDFGRGGAVYYHLSEYLQERNQFIRNRADLNGSAVYAYLSTGVVVADRYLDNQSFQHNRESALATSYGSVAVSSSVFQGEGLRATDMDSIVVEQNLFRYSDVWTPGAFVVHQSATATVIRNNVFIGNGGGVVGFGDGGDGGALILGNTVCGFRRGITVNHGPNVLRNNLIYDNRGGVIWTAWPGSSIDAQYNLLSNFDYDMYQYAVGFFYGENNMFQIDPGVVARGVWDYRGTPDDPYDDVYTPGDHHLTRNSPCINAGDPALVFDAHERDMDGQVRTAAGRADIGADEYPAIGDLNGDGVLNNFDIDAFVLALLDRDAHAATYPLADAELAGDVNADGVFNNFDIDVFIACLLNAGCP